MGNFFHNLALYLKFKCVWLTFYLFPLFPSTDLSSLRLCYGVPWQTVAQWDPGTRWQRNSYELSMNCFIHQVHALALPLYVTIPVIKNAKMSALTYRYFPPSDTESKHWVVNSNFCSSSNCFPAGQFRLQSPEKEAHCVGTRMLFCLFVFVFYVARKSEEKLRFLIRPCIALDH